MALTVCPVTRGSDGVPAQGGKGPGQHSTCDLEAGSSQGQVGYLEPHSDGSFSEVPDVSLGPCTNSQHQVPADACLSS